MTDRTGGRGAASPVVVFLCLLLLLGGITGIVIWTGQIDAEPIPPAPVPSSSPEASETLTDEEAIARFKELDALRLRAFETRDTNLLSDVFVSSAQQLREAKRTISKLRRDEVVMRHKPYRNRSISVLQASARRIELQQEVIFHIVFKDERGEEVTQQGAPELLTIRWVLTNVNGEWLIHSGEVTAAESYRSK